MSSPGCKVKSSRASAELEGLSGWIFTGECFRLFQTVTMEISDLNLALMISLAGDELKQGF